MSVPRALTVGGVAAALSLAGVPGARAAVAGTAAEPVRGMDISAYQHAGAPINWRLIAAQGIRFVAIKASEGTYYHNPYYASDARAAASAGLRVMPYVFANPGRGSGTATANFAVAVAGGQRGVTLLPYVVDLENNPYKKHDDCYGRHTRAMIGWIAQFTARTRALTGHWPIIYTTNSWWRECTGSTRKFPHDPLWLAAFGGTRPAVPAPWQNWTFWQYNNAGTLRGIGHTDLDYYQPTHGLPALYQRAKVAAKHTTKPKPKPKPKAKVAAKHTAKAKVMAKAKAKATGAARPVTKSSAGPDSDGD